jgi:hypothetical protein
MLPTDVHLELGSRLFEGLNQIDLNNGSVPPNRLRGD